ncbi:MAG TPA: hypothetical protein VI958_09935 [Acidobacteriota bacterium]
MILAGSVIETANKRDIRNIGRNTATKNIASDFVSQYCRGGFMQELLYENRQAIAWLLLWVWIAITLFILAYKGSKPMKLYIFNLLLLAGSIFMFLWE